MTAFEAAYSAWNFVVFADNVGQLLCFVFLTGTPLPLHQTFKIRRLLHAWLMTTEPMLPVSLRL